MKQLLLLLAIAGCLPVLHGQDLNTLEYFMDTDPGYGKATRINLPAGQNLNYRFTLDLSALSMGFHVAGFRTGNVSGTWSHTHQHAFFITSDRTSNLLAAEYFIDIDPGDGRAVPLPAGIAAGTLNTVLPLTQLSHGFHLVGFRVKDDKQVWSHTREHMVYVADDGAAKYINRIEYYYTGGGTTPVRYTYTVPVPGLQVDLSFRTDLSQLLPDSNYVLHMIAIAGDSSRSAEVTKAFRVNAMVTSVNQLQADGFILRQNFPNPVQTNTWISFDLPQPQYLRMQLFDQEGKRLRQLFARRLNAGNHLIQQNMSALPHGVYTLIFQSEKYLVSMKLVK